MLFYLFFNRISLAILAAFLFEVFEVSLNTLFQTGGPLFTSLRDDETLAASYIGDVVVQGGTGIFIGYCIRSLFLLPTLVSTTKRAKIYPGGGWARFWYFVLYFVMAASYLFCSIMASSGLRSGLIVQTVIMLLFITIVIPFGLNARDIDKLMIWQQMDGTMYGGWHKFGAFATWALTVLVVHAPHFPATQPWYSTNEWFMQWIVSIPLASILGISLIIVSIQRNDGATAWATVGLLFIIGTLASWIAFGIGNATATGLFVLGLILFIVAIACFIRSATGAWRVPSAESITRRGSKRTALPAMAELPQEKQKDASKKVRIAEAHIRWM